jgi:hypothetical protein
MVFESPKRGARISHSIYTIYIARHNNIYAPIGTAIEVSGTFSINYLNHLWNTVLPSDEGYASELY